MFCDNCGTELMNGASFCMNCGNKIDESKKMINWQKKDANEEVKKLQRDLETALPIYKQLTYFFKQLNLYYKRKDHSGGIMLGIGIVLYVIVMIFYAYFWMFISTIFPSIGKGSSIESFGDLFVVWACHLFIILVITSAIMILIIRLWKKYYMKKIDELRTIISEYFDKVNCEELYCLPEDYQTYEAANFIYGCIVNRRANSLIEAINLYEEQCYRQQVGQALNNIQRQQTLLQATLLLK